MKAIVLGDQDSGGFLPQIGLGVDWSVLLILPVAKPPELAVFSQAFLSSHPGAFVEAVQKDQVTFGMQNKILQWRPSE